MPPHAFFLAVVRFSLLLSIILAGDYAATATAGATAASSSLPEDDARGDDRARHHHPAGGGPREDGGHDADGVHPPGFDVCVNCHAVFDLRVVVVNGGRSSSPSPSRRIHRRWWRVTLDEVRDDGALISLADGRAIPVAVDVDVDVDDRSRLRDPRPYGDDAPHSSYSSSTKPDRNAALRRRHLLGARVAVPYSHFVPGGPPAAVASRAREAVVVASLVRVEEEDGHPSSDYEKDDNDDDYHRPPSSDDDAEIAAAVTNVDDRDLEEGERRGRKMREIVVDRWLFNVAVPPAADGRDGGGRDDGVGGDNKGKIIGGFGGRAATSYYRDPIYEGTLEDADDAPPSSFPDAAEEEEEEEEEEVLAAREGVEEGEMSKNGRIEEEEVPGRPTTREGEEERGPIARACVCGTLGGIAVLFAIASWSSYFNDVVGGDDDALLATTPSPHDARALVGNDDDDLPRYSFEEHGMRGRRLSCEFGGEESPSSSSSLLSSSSSSSSRDGRYRGVRAVTTADSNGEVPRGRSGLDGQIESGSSSPRDSNGGGASSSSSCRDGIIGGPDAAIGIDSAGNDVTSNPAVHDEPHESDMARPLGRSDDCIVPSSSGEYDEDESSCCSNDDSGIVKMKDEKSKIGAEVDSIATTMRDCDLEIFSPRYSQYPDDITPLPHSNTSSMFEETTESEENLEQWDGSSRSNAEMPQAKESNDCEHQFCGTNTPKLGSALMGNAESNAKGTASSPVNNTASQEEKSPGLWQQIRLLTENDEAEPTNCDADVASSDIGNNSISSEEKFNNEKIDVEDEKLKNGIYTACNACCEKNIERDIGIEANNGINANVNVTEACRSNLRAGKAIVGPTSPPKIGRIVQKESSPSFPRFEPVAVVAPSIAQSFSEKKNRVEQQHEQHQPSPRDSLNPSVSSSAITATVHNSSCSAKRSHPSASEVEGREDDIPSQLSTAITRGQADGKRRRQQSTKVTHARVSTSPISRPQRSSELQFGIDRARVNRNDDFEESSHADHVEKENHSCPADAFEQHRDPNEVSFGPDANCFSGGYDSSPPSRMPLSTRSAGNQRAPLKHQDGFPSPASTVAATVQEFTAPRRKMQIMHDSSDRPFPIPSGGAGQSKRFEKSCTDMSSSNEGPYQQSSSDSAHHDAAESFERVPHPSSSNQSEDRESRSKKKIRKIEKKLLATSKVPAVYKPSSALIPLSQRLEEPAWQFSCAQRREQSF